MQKIITPLVFIAVVLLIPILPLVVFGEVGAAELDAWLKKLPSPTLLATAVAALLAVDIFLPVPSSLVSTLAGGELGPWLGTLAAWLGMTAGAVLGFALARLFGRPLARRFSNPEELARIERLSQKHGPLILVLVRALPAMAEASVLLMGASGLSWRRFLPPVLASNLGIALAYALFGHVAERHGLLPLALAVAVALPVLAITMVHRILPADPEGPRGDAGHSP